jgi:hypothetical protein
MSGLVERGVADRQEGSAYLGEIKFVQRDVQVILYFCIPYTR